MYTGWDSRVKEFGRFIAHSASPETGGAWQIWEQIYDEQKDGWHLPTPLVSTDEFVGHPAIALDSQGRLHLFWHSKQDGPWQIWQRVETKTRDRRQSFGAATEIGSWVGQLL
ncbi:MAG: hypothetical protein IPM76_16455 [Chloroflexi bacterium]|nr:hypothetical protein [Chloroflexota bacterium]